MYFLARLWRHLPALSIVAVVIWAQFRFCQLLFRYGALRRSPGWRLAIRVAAAILAAWIAMGVVGTYAAFWLGLRGSSTLAWIRGVALAWALAAAAALAILSLWRRLPKFSQDRRGFIRAAGAACVGAPFAAMSFGILVQRTDIRLREVDVPIFSLPKDLDGLRIVQLSDIHLSPFLSERELERAVDMANGLRANLALVTGDLISSHGDPLDACLRQVARLRADAGTLGCLGNHEIYAGVVEETTRKAARLGIGFLRQESRRLRFGNAALSIAGVDYQQTGTGYLRGAESWIEPGVPNILLSHNPVQTKPRSVRQRARRAARPCGEQEASGRLRLMETVITDAGPLVAYLKRDDKDHDWFSDLPQAPAPADSTHPSRLTPLR